ncbi:Tetraspanin-2 [Sesamum angolense]|uniref:Tetraspanin-2 n=1 Tax=Sesamum angolense TaxID=2727404 RepID=A0AAE1WEA6_9LAMI|nr:Tetraspanin-2 [Sesamum angolense]
MAVSNNITAILNFVALMCSIPIISAGIWLASKPDNECIHWLRWPLVFLVLLLVLLVLAFVVTRPDGSYPVPGMGFREYRAGGLVLLRDHITGNDNWGKIRACLADSQILSQA